MNVIPFVHEGLGNSSYLVALPDGAAALIDPDRTVGRYLQAAGARAWSITTVLETHLHADFVSGAREIAHATGARLFVPEGAHSKLEHTPVQPGARVRLDGVEVEAIASAGHTPEHLSYALRSAAAPPSLFSGGSLIVGGAARTDLIAPDLTESLTRAQYRTLKEAFTTLPDETVLYPTHGGGSFCSTGQGGDRASTLGRERADNPLLSFSDEEEFTRWFPTTFPATPAYYSRMRDVNAKGPPLREELSMPRGLSPDEFDAARRGALVVDVRSKEQYASAHITGSLSNAFRDAYCVWLGWLAPADAALLFVLGDAPLERVVEESLLVGYERFAGFLDGGLEAWERGGRSFQRTPLIGAREARRTLVDGAAALDVREPDEFAAGHVEGAIHVPLGDLEERLDELPRDRPFVVYCAHGERSTSAASILERHGVGPAQVLDGGFGAWREAGMAAR